MSLRKKEVLHYLSETGKDVFQEWLGGLKDIKGRAIVLKHISRLEEGYLGDHRSVGEGVWELRIHFGPGYRVYYGEDGASIVLLLCGGDKHSQKRDIRVAHHYWADYRRSK